MKNPKSYCLVLRLIPQRLSVRELALPAKQCEVNHSALKLASPYQDGDLEDFAVFDSGDLELPFGNTQRVLDQIEEHTAEILKDGKIPCMIGGEHLVTLGAMRAVVKQYP